MFDAINSTCLELSTRDEHFIASLIFDFKAINAQSQRC